MRVPVAGPQGPGREDPESISYLSASKCDPLVSMLLDASRSCSKGGKPSPALSLL